jgi:hypothetical protein
MDPMLAHRLYKASRLAGRLAVVTGASSGIGRAISVALTRERAQLIRPLGQFAITCGTKHWMQVARYGTRSGWAASTFTTFRFDEPHPT